MFTVLIQAMSQAASSSLPLPNMVMDHHVRFFGQIVHTAANEMPSPCDLESSRNSTWLETPLRKILPHVVDSHWIWCENVEYQFFTHGKRHRENWRLIDCGHSYVQDEYVMKTETAVLCSTQLLGYMAGKVRVISVTNLVSMNHFWTNVFQKIHCTLSDNMSTIEDMLWLWKPVWYGNTGIKLLKTTCILQRYI